MNVEELGPTDLGREELVAEFTAGYLCAETGIAPATIENQVAYIGNWTRVLQGDRRGAGGGGRRSAAGSRLHPRSAACRRWQRPRVERRSEHGDARREDVGREPDDALDSTTDLDAPRIATQVAHVAEELR